MKYIAAILLVFAFVSPTHSQTSVTMQDTTELPAHSLRAIATVKDADYDFMTIVVENVVAYSRGVTSTPTAGDELIVRLPGRNKPKTDSRIEVDLQESIDLGAAPSSYLALGFRTIE